MGLCLDGRISGQNPAFEPNVRIGGDPTAITAGDWRIDCDFNLIRLNDLVCLVIRL